MYPLDIMLNLDRSLMMLASPLKKGKLLPLLAQVGAEKVHWHPYLHGFTTPSVDR